MTRTLDGTPIGSARTAIAAAAFVLVTALSAYAGSAGLDPTFGPGGVVRVPVSDSIGGFLGALPDGGAVVAGNTSAPQPRRIWLAQLRPDGSLDPAFGDGGIAYPAFRARNPGDPSVDAVQALRRQSDGRIVVAGFAGRLDTFGRPTEYAIGVMRLLANGAPDPDFGTDGALLIDPIEGERVMAIAVQSDGAVVIGGDAAIDDNREMVLRRIDSTGAVDTAFGTGGVLVPRPDPGELNQLHGLAVWPDDSFAAVGVAFEGPNQLDQVSVVARFHPNGTPYETFGAGGIVLLRNDEWPIGAAVTTAGLAVVTTRFGAFRLLDDGTVDGGFGTAGFTRFPFAGVAFASAIAADAQGRLVLAGEAKASGNLPYGAALARLTADGLPDPDFGAGGALVTPIGSDGALIGVDALADDRIVGAGFGRPDGHVNETFVVRYDPAAEGGCAPASALLSARHLGVPAGDELVSVSAVLDPGAGALVDPTVGEVRLAILAADGTPLVEVATPGGVFDRRFDFPGWRVRGGGRAWSFVDPDGATGVRSLVVSRVSAAKVRVTMRVQKPIAITPADLPLRVRVDVPQGVCGSATFAPGACRAGADSVSCR